MEPAEAPRDREDAPGSAAEQRQLVGAVDAVHDDPGPTLYADSLVHRRYRRAAGGGRGRRHRLALQAIDVGGIAHQAQNRAVAPREDLRFAALAELQEFGL